LLNAHHEAIPFTLPTHKDEQDWELLLDTAEPQQDTLRLNGGQQWNLQGRSIAVFRTRTKTEGREHALTPEKVDQLLRDHRRQSEPAVGVLGRG
jgi:glycogen operon protein